MAPRRLLVVVLGAMLAACGGPPVVADSRGNFDTANGMYGGNEFTPLSAEGKRTFEGDAPAAAKTAAAPAPATPTTAPSAPPVAAMAAAPMAAAPVSPAQVTIAIEGNAFGAVFGAASAPVRPTPAQLLQLDSLSLVVADALRVELQTSILACRRAGEACRLAPR